MPEEPPDTRRLYVPLSDAGCGVCLRLFRDRGGERCAVGFSRLEQLVELLGPDQHYYRLTVRSIRELAAAREVTDLVVDPVLVGAPVAALAPADAVRDAVPAGRSFSPGVLRAAWERSQAAGIIAVSAGAGATALMLEVLK